MLFRILAVLLSATLAGCGGTTYTSPDGVNLEPARLPRMLVQSVTLTNAWSEPAPYQVRMNGHVWQLDARQLTDTAIAGLQRALEKQGVRSVPQAPKRMTFRIRVSGASATPAPPSIAARARLTLEVEFGDGTTTSVYGDNGSAFGVQRAFEGAIRSALNVLVLDAKFIDYLNE